jgi:hypothetical protein
MAGASPRRGLPRIRGTQVGLRDPSLVDQLKADMLAGQFVYHETRGRIGGLRDPRGTYYVIEGHHRIAAALEILHETGDGTALRSLLLWGNWKNEPFPPTDHRPLPSRPWWGALRNWLGW